MLSLRGPLLLCIQSLILENAGYYRCIIHTPADNEHGGKVGQSVQSDPLIKEFVYGVLCLSFIAWKQSLLPCPVCA